MNRLFNMLAAMTTGHWPVRSLLRRNTHSRELRGTRVSTPYGQDLVAVRAPL